MCQNMPPPPPRAGGELYICITAAEYLFDLLRLLRELIEEA